MFNTEQIEEILFPFQLELGETSWRPDLTQLVGSLQEKTKLYKIQS